MKLDVRLKKLYSIYGEDGEMVEPDARKVLTIPRSIKVEEVVHRGFMSNFLFQNIGAIFAAPAAVREVLKSRRSSAPKQRTQSVNHIPRRHPS